MASVFVVDDAEADLQLIRSMLESGRHDVISCREPREVEQKIQESHPDVVLLDIVMPERSGYDVLRKLKRNPATKGIPVVLVSSKSEESDIFWGKSQGADEYLPKPFKKADLLAVVDRMVAKKA